MLLFFCNWYTTHYPKKKKKIGMKNEMKKNERVNGKSYLVT